jgi:hypothetical protein
LDCADKIGKRALLMMSGSILLMPVYLMMGYSNISLFVPICMMGVAFSLIPAVMLAIGGLHSRAEPAKDGLRFDDADSAGWILRIEPAEWPG